ncbi:MAG: DEAD/DEAH box helicase [Bacteroidota bacterium]
MNEFGKLGLSSPILQAIEAMGFVDPTPIQQKAIPLLLDNQKDLVGLAQTGTGKTAAFGLPLLDLVDAQAKHTQALVLAPTRELCVQICKELNLFAKQLKQLRILPVYGGTDIVRQIREIKKGVHIITATPGRLRDLIRRKAVDIRQIGHVVLDEADEMLNMGFKEEIDDILSNTPADKRTWLFSATMPPEVKRIAQNYMHAPLEISVAQLQVGNVDIAHQYVLVKGKEKYEALKRFLDYDANTFSLVFTRTRRDAKEVAEQLMQDGYNADALHGDLNQAQRDRVMNSFRRRRLQVLVATDVAARGIDVQEITHVFHYNIPDDLSFYTHRSGRTGRAGKKGVSLVLAHPRDKSILRRIEKSMRLTFEAAHIPTGPEICEQRLLTYIRRLREVPISEDIETFLPAIYDELEDLSKADLIARLASLSFSRFLEQYRHSPDLNIQEKDRRKGSRTAQMKRLFINVGSMDVQDKSGFLALICGGANIPGSMIGKIDMRRKHAFFEVEEPVAHQVIKAFNDVQFQGRTLRVNEDAGAPGITPAGKKDKGRSSKRKGKDFKRRKKWKRR